MTATSSNPADVRDMGIIHSALRRDLERARILLDGTMPMSDERRRDIAVHLVWMLDFLHVHHTDEDTALWPEIRRRNAAAGELIDVMEADHRRIGPAIEALHEAARRWTTDRAAKAAVSAALAALAQDLLPHLRREEEQIMPIVSQTMSQEEYETLAREAFVKTKSKKELGREGFWVVDGLDETGQKQMMGKVPGPIRFVLGHTFGPGYRRRAARMWGGTPAAEVPSLSLAHLDERR